MAHVVACIMKRRPTRQPIPSNSSRRNDELSVPASMSANAGFVDTAGFLALLDVFNAHVTGNFVALGASLQPIMMDATKEPVQIAQSSRAATPISIRHRCFRLAHCRSIVQRRCDRPSMELSGQPFCEDERSIRAWISGAHLVCFID